MTTTCANLSPFMDGELEPAEADAFREHLSECAECQSGLGDFMVMEALAAQAAEKRKDGTEQNQGGST